MRVISAYKINIYSYKLAITTVADINQIESSFCSRYLHRIHTIKIFHESAIVPSFCRHASESVYVGSLKLLFVIGFQKTDNLHPFIVLRNVNLKNSLSYNSAIVSSRSMGFALEIKHHFSFKQRGLIITDSLSCLIWGGLYWHGCNIRSDAYKERVGGGRMVATGLQL